MHQTGASGSSHHALRKVTIPRTKPRTIDQRLRQALYPTHRWHSQSNTRIVAVPITARHVTSIPVTHLPTKAHDHQRGGCITWGCIGIRDQGAVKSNMTWGLLPVTLYEPVVATISFYKFILRSYQLPINIFTTLLQHISRN